MNREADFTIKGFLYQFNKTLIHILDAEDYDEITVEGVIEDIDIKTEENISAIQCKYHETADKFSISSIYKPLLQMICHYLDNKQYNIHYTLYAHYPNLPYGNKVITIEDVHKALNSKNIDFIVKYISKIKPPNNPIIKELLDKSRKTEENKKEIKKYYDETDLEIKFNIEEFLQNKFSFVIGEPYEDLVEKVKTKLTNEKFSQKDVDDLFYPNAIQHISELSVLHNPANRKTNRKEFVDRLEKTKRTAITRWTKELTTYQKLLKSRRMQLKSNLSINNRKRYFILDPQKLEDFDEQIINFVKDYIDKYHFKVKLHKETPIFIIKCEDGYVRQLEERLYTRGITAITGNINGNFYSDKFLSEPKRVIKDDWREFDIKLANLNENTIESINKKKCDDLFVVGEYLEDYMKDINTKDISLELLGIDSFSELKYLLSIKEEL